MCLTNKEACAANGAGANRSDTNHSDDDMLDPPRFVSGTAKSFRCPYHYWVYDLEGQLIGAPEMTRTTGFDTKSVRLPSLAVELWQGFIFVNLDSSAEPLSPKLRKLDEALTNYRLDQLITVDPAVIDDVPFNWKIMVENFMESYHNSRLHHGIHDWAPSSGASYTDYEPGDGAMFGFNRTLEPDGGFNPTFRALFPVLPGTTLDERQQVVFALVPPSLLIGIQSDSAFWFAVDPTGPTSHALSMAYLFPESTVEMPQDMPTNMSVQFGMQSRFAPRGRYSWQEGVLAQFNSWLVDHYESHASQ